MSSATTDEKKIAFFDTNVINSKSYMNELFGNHKLLERISDEYEIKIPRVVLDELIEHKRRQFEEDKNRILKSEIARTALLQTKKIEELKFCEIIENIQNKETIEYEVIEAQKAEDFFNHFYRRAVESRPPFDKKSDKGFKDACVASSVLSYLATHSGIEEVALVTGDTRLSEVFKHDKSVKVYSSVQELPLRRNKENDEISNEISRKVNNTEIDIGSKPDGERIRAEVYKFCNSTSFSSTHSAVSALRKLGDPLTVVEKKSIINASVDNAQISYVLKDVDVNEFVVPIFLDVESSLPDRIYREFVNSAGLPDNRTDPYGNPVFSTCEKRSYERFMNSLIDNITSRNFDSRIDDDAAELIRRLRTLLAEASLDESYLSWERVSSAVFQGGVNASSDIAPVEVVKSFTDFIQRCSKLKRESIMKAMAQRLSEVEIDYGSLPF